MAIASKDDLKEYCLTALGAPVLEINVTADQIDDRIDEAFQVFREYHYDATFRTYLKHQVTSTDISNGYITLNSDYIYVVRVLPLSSMSYSSGMFSFEYQYRLQNLYNLQNFTFDLSYYVQMRQHMSLIDMELTGQPQITFSRHQNRLYIHGNFNDGDVKAGDYLIAEVISLIDPDTHTSVYNNMWLKEYTTALIKRQWAQNLSKFEGVQLPGGVTISSDKMMSEAREEITNLRQRLREEFEEPVDFYVG